MACRPLLFSGALAACLLQAAGCRSQQPRVRTAIHAHNDYEHARPLFDALDAGARSIEADVHLIGGSLVVAHNRPTTQTLTTRPQLLHRTLESLYLQPLASLPSQRRRPLILLIDIKGKPAEVYPVLRSLLQKYEPILIPPSSTLQQIRPTAFVRVILTGNQPPRADLMAEPLRLVASDGAMADLDAAPPPPASLVPLISANWKAHFTWRGTGPLPEAEGKLLERWVAQAHAQGRTIRFWNAPDHPRAWSNLQAARVDWINTDHLPEARAFLAALR